MKDRLVTLQKYYDEDPSDPFNAYALALELMKHDLERAREMFETVMREHPDYVPAYYHAGKAAEQAGDATRARAIFERGLDVCRKAQNLKTMREIQSAIDQLTDDF